MTLFYTDTSNNNWSSDQQLIDYLSQQIPQGFAGVAHKMSEGNYYQDPYGKVAQSWCAANGVPFIGYHYVTTDDPGTQAQCWRNAGGGNEAMMDWEANGGGLTNLYNVLNAFNAAGINGQISYAPQWYYTQSGGGDLSQAGFLCSSAYPGGSGYASVIYENVGGDAGEGWASYGNATPVAWQFTDSALVAGITVDCNAYRGADLNVLFGIAAVPPTPPVVTPPAPVVTPPAPPVPPVTPPVTPVSPVPPTTSQLEQLLAMLVTELSASGSDTLPAEDPTQPNLTLRQAIKAILWKTTFELDLTGRPRDPSLSDDLYGHILSMRAEGLITQALVTSLCEAAKIDTATIIADAKGAL